MHALQIKSRFTYWYISRFQYNISIGYCKYSKIQTFFSWELPSQILPRLLSTHIPQGHFTPKFSWGVKRFISFPSLSTQWIQPFALSDMNRWPKLSTHSPCGIYFAFTPCPTRDPLYSHLIFPLWSTSITLYLLFKMAKYLPSTSTTRVGSINIWLPLSSVIPYSFILVLPSNEYTATWFLSFLSWGPTIQTTISSFLVKHKLFGKKGAASKKFSQPSIQRDYAYLLVTVRDKEVVRPQCNNLYVFLFLWPECLDFVTICIIQVHVVSLCNPSCTVSYWYDRCDVDACVIRSYKPQVYSRRHDLWLSRVYTWFWSYLRLLTCFR